MVHPPREQAMDALELTWVHFYLKRTHVNSSPSIVHLFWLVWKRPGVVLSLTPVQSKQTLLQHFNAEEEASAPPSLSFNLTSSTQDGEGEPAAAMSGVSPSAVFASTSGR